MFKSHRGVDNQFKYKKRQSNFLDSSESERKLSPLPLNFFEKFSLFSFPGFVFDQDIPRVEEALVESLDFSIYIYIQNESIKE